MLTRRRILASLGAAAMMPGCQIASAERVDADAARALGPGVARLERFVWRAQVAGFGGLSALHLERDGAQFLALGDRGVLWQGRLVRDPAGQITGVTNLGQHLLRGTDGQPLPRAMADAEGIARAPDGVIYVSFEGGAQARLAAYDAPGAAARALPVPPALTGLPVNQSLEALACDARGTLFIVPETAQSGAFGVQAFDGRAWQGVGRIPARDGFVPVGADFGPDGLFYLLERRFQRPFFASRVSRIAPPAWDRPQTVFQSPLGMLDNHEGLCVRRAGTGGLRLTLISDDNFNRFQRTEFVEVHLA